MRKATNRLSWLERVHVMVRRRTSMPCARMSVLAVLMLSLSAAQIAAALRCYCSDCSNGQSECTGDLCFAQIVNNEGTSLRRWRCYNSASLFLCNTSSYLHTTVCCNSTDLCNTNLSPTLSPPTTTASSSTSSGVVTTQPATQSTLAPVINPLTGSDSSDPEPTSSPLNASTSQEGSPLLARSCYESDSEQENIVRLCELHTDNWCFSTWRRRNNGVVHFRRGCANSCQPANRNRKVKLCCRSSLCNVDELPQNISNNSSNSSQRGGGTEVSTTLSPITPPPSTPSLTTPPPSTPPTLPPSSSPSSPSTSLRPILEPETDPPPVTQTQAPTIVGFFCHCSHCTGRFCLTTTGCVLQRVLSRGRIITTQSCLSESNQDICVMNSTATTTIECCTSGLCNRNLEGENTFLPPTTSPQTTTDQSGPSIHFPSLVPETTMQATTASTTGDTAERTNERTTQLTIGPTTWSLQDTASSTPHPNTSTSTRPQSQSLSIYYILIIVLSALTVLIIVCIAGVCVYLFVEYKRKRQDSVNMCDHSKETDLSLKERDSSLSTPV